MISVADVHKSGCDAKCPFVLPSQLGCTRSCFPAFLSQKLVFNPPGTVKESCYRQRGRGTSTFLYSSTTLWWRNTDGFVYQNPEYSRADVHACVHKEVNCNT